MTKRLIGAAALALVAAAPAQASAAVPKPLRAEYQQHYKEVAKRHGDRAPGCNLFRTCKGKATTARVRKSNATLERMLYVPKPPAPVSTPAPASAPASTAPAPTASVVSGSGATGSGGYSIPSSIVMCESGGDYNAVNPSSGAYGAYQILPSTSAGLGCDMSTPAGQDRCAAKVWATQGRGAWVC